MKFRIGDLFVVRYDMTEFNKRGIITRISTKFDAHEPVQELLEIHWTEDDGHRWRKEYDAHRIRKELVDSRFAKHCRFAWKHYPVLEVGRLACMGRSYRYRCWYRCWYQ